MRAALQCAALLLLCAAAAAAAAPPHSPAAYCSANIGPIPDPVRAACAGRLLLVQTVIRHGDRTPLTVMPQIPGTWNCALNSVGRFAFGDDADVAFGRAFRLLFQEGEEVLPGNCMFGQLTDLGAAQHEGIGKYLRAIYGDQLHFISDNLTADDVYVRSTNVYRTLQSAQANLHGMFSEPLAQTVVPVLPLYTRDSAREDMVPNTALCPRFAAYSDWLASNDVWQQHQASMADIRSALTTLYGGNVPSYTSILDSLHASYCHNVEWPSPFTMDMYARIEKEASWEFAYLAGAGNATIMRVGIGSFVKLLHDNMQDVVKAGGALQGPKYRLFSGHDSTVGPLLSALQLNPDNTWPPYASHVELELWENNGSFFVSVFYNGQHMATPGCPQATYCDFDTFSAGIRSVMPTDYAAECAM